MPIGAGAGVAVGAGVLDDVGVARRGWRRGWCLRCGRRWRWGCGGRGAGLGRIGHRRRSGVLRIGNGPNDEVCEVAVGIDGGARRPAGAPLQAGARRWHIRGQPFQPGAGGSSPTDSIDGGGGTLNAQRHAAAGGGHAAGVERIGDRREAAELVGDEEMGTRWHLGSAEAPGRPPAHRRAAGRDVDELESLEGQRRRRWVVELDQLVARARAAGHHLADDEVIDGRRGRPIDSAERQQRGRKQADDDDADGRRSARAARRRADGQWTRQTPRGRRRRPPQDAGRTLTARLVADYRAVRRRSTIGGHVHR